MIIIEGAGFLVNRAFGYNHTADFDPFLMLDFFNQDIDKSAYQYIDNGEMMINKKNRFNVILGHQGNEF